MAYVSVIVPTYNSQSVIESCLRAVRASAFQDYELIVVDDASTDDTFSLASKYTENVIKLPLKKGRSCARNSAIKVAKGEIIVNIDSDIIIKPDTLNKIVDYFINHPEIDILTGCLAKTHPHPNFLATIKICICTIYLANYQKGLHFYAVRYAPLGENLYNLVILMSKSPKIRN